MDTGRLDLLRATSQSRATNKTWSYLLMGNPFCGKTVMATTGKSPTLIYCFDPNGTASINDKIQSGEVVVREYLDTDPLSPTAYKDFQEDFSADIKAGLFGEDGIQTVVIDSLTTLAEAIMASILKKANRPNTTPQIQDYGALGGEIWATCRKLIDLPCDKVLTAHIHREKDELTGGLVTSVLMSGKSAEKLPILFDEQYVIQSVKGEVKALTQNDGMYTAGTRMGVGGKFDKYESPNLTAMRTKAGF